MAAVEDCCDIIVKKVKELNLHYHFEETPFGIQIKIRKRFIDDEAPKKGNLKTAHVIENLEMSLKTLKRQFEIKSEECESYRKENNCLKEDMAKIDEELCVTKVELTKQYGENADQKKIVKNLKKELVILNTEACKMETNHLEEIKLAKHAFHEKDLRIQEVIAANKKLYKEIFTIKGESAKFNDTKHVESPSTSKIKCHSSKTSSCQTDEHPDNPYAITEPLPPIFGSKFCFLTPRIKHLSHSLPNLNTVLWVNITDEERLRDEAEEALAEHYDDQVKQFYLEHKERIHAERWGKT